MAAPLARLRRALADALSRYRRGDLAQSAAILTKLLRAYPRLDNAHHLLGLVRVGEGRAEEGLRHLREATRLAPQVAAYHNNLGTVLDQLAATQDALAAFDAAISCDPRHVAAHNNRGRMLRRLGRWEEALGAFERALALDPENPSAHAGLVEILGRVETRNFSPTVAGALARCYASPLTDFVAIARATALQLRLKHGPDLTRETALQALGADPMLHAYLRTGVNTDWRLEKPLGLLRRAALDGGADHALVCALAAQGFNNEYALAVTAEEAVAVERLAARAASAIAAGSDPVTLEPTLARVAMYRPLHAAEYAAQLAEVAEGGWSEAFAPVVRHTVRDVLEERSLQEGIVALAPIEDPVSRAVRAQYEANPYPRLIHVPQRVPLPPAVHVQQKFPHYVPTPAMLSAGEVLIAGCGTGHQAITAARTYENQRILAIDLSRASLACAIRMARLYRVEEITFLQADILDLDRLDRQFAVIECNGVLHHMGDPWAGWAALVRRLRPGGAMRIGLYSERARSAVVAARERIAARGIPSTPDGIRQFRAEVVAEGADGELSRLLDAYDFYTVSTCRDFVFHVQEHRLTLLQIAEAIASSGLRFIGFEHEDPTIAARYRAEHPDDPDMTDLWRWDAFEAAHPDLIEGYVFWCEKPATA